MLNRYAPLSVIVARPFEIWARQGNPVDKNLDAALLALKHNYILSLPSKIDEIQVLWGECKLNNDSVVLKEIYRKVHSLAGSGATFGQEELSKKAKKIELFIQENIESGEILSNQNVTAFDAYIVELYFMAKLAAKNIKPLDAD